MRHVESRIQEACVRWFRMQFPHIGNLLFSVPNGGTRFLREAVTLKKEGLVAGVSDLILLIPNGEYGALCIEVKTPDKNSRQSKAQKEWQALVESVGIKYIVVRDFYEFVKEVKQYLSSVVKEDIGLF